MPNKTLVTVEAAVEAPIATAWDCWTKPEHIMQWNNASDDWHTPSATIDLQEGGTFTSRMEAKDGSVGFDFRGTFTKVEPEKKLEYTMEDGRTVSIIFEEKQGTTHIAETFVAEDENPVEMQREGWQAILNNFKKYTASQAKS